MKRARTAVALIAVLMIVRSAIGQPQEVAEVAFSFSHGPNGVEGVAIARIDTQKGKIVGQRSVFESLQCEKPKKLRRSVQPPLLVLTNEAERGKHVFLIDPNGKPDQQPRAFSFGDVPDELRIANKFALAVVTCKNDFIYTIDLNRGVLTHQLDAAKMLDPPGNAPEDIFLLDNKFAVVSFQKDSKNPGPRQKKGCRLVIFSLPKMDKLADLKLPRDHPELHTENPKEKGPNPEIVYVSPATNRLLATLDLYGGVGVMDWNAAVQGRVEHYRYLPTNMQPQWGNSFPDRLAPLDDGRVLVCNAGVNGGAVVVDLQEPAIAWRVKTPPGLETPVYIPELKRAFAACPGKKKQRAHPEVQKADFPQPGVWVFDISQESVQQVAPPHWNTFELTRVANSDYLLIAAGPNKEATHFVLFDAKALKVVDKAEAVGEVEQFESD